ncbi:MAG TPA: ABC transporter ATP-binding protein [Flavobacterium sp.]|uniref:ABC transporter ATP-binding protein n=1 Tax=Flavobacterium sp. TaxID=239 RepID=UPI002B4B1217|nr:ABC transporter ATP-binding protein [Flavobacterium sp.]HLO73758.1 ABC transporter ATP-binding protein [Flavobacterium sp.]
MSKVVIKSENISKQYRLGLVGTGTVKDDMKRWWHNLRGKEDPFLKIGEANDRSSKGESDYVWSLRDINFEINQGDSVGIIGRNGAGKSTLLKILSQVTQPTTGKIYTKGRIASLLEVGTGFHPEMTGRENIYLNGAILGMRKHEIKRKFDEIVAFSGVERYIDTPVKRYSSGMYVRLAFAVAAHLESEILIVDEVLAVGDAEFQKKCLGKMNDVSKGEGRTILFVSHNLDAVKKLCNKGLLLHHGQLIHDGNIDTTLDSYLLNYSSNEKQSELNFHEDETKEAQILSVALKDKEGKNVIEFYSNQEICVHITLKNTLLSKGVRLNFSLLDKFENVIFINRKDLDFTGISEWLVQIPSDTIIANQYKIGLALDIPKVKVLDYPTEKINLSIVNIAQDEFKYGDTENGVFKMPVIWSK